MDDQQAHHPEFQAPPDLLAEAKINPDEFRSKTIAALRAAGCQGAANAVRMMLWPAWIWGMLCTWAESGHDGHERHADASAAARDHLGALAEASGISFIWSDANGDYVAIGHFSPKRISHQRQTPEWEQPIEAPCGCGRIIMAPPGMAITCIHGEQGPDDRLLPH